MNAPSATELKLVRQAEEVRAPAALPGDYVVHWRSSFGDIVIEARGEQVFVNGELVQPADGARGSNSSQRLGRIEGIPHGA